MLVIFGVVLGVYGLAKWKELPTRAERRENARRIFPEAAGIDEKKIDQVQIDRDGKTLVFQRRGPRWQMTEPIDVLAEPGSIDSIVRGVKNLDMKAGGLVVLEGGEGLEKYGLEKPHATVTLFRNGEAVAKLLTGDKHPIDKEATYVKSADEDKYVFLVANFNIDSLDKSQTELREKDLITVDRFAADYVQVAWGDRQITAEKRGDQWQLASPIEDRADQTKVQDLIRDAGQVRVEKDADFIDDKAEDLANYGLDKPQVTVEVRKPGEKKTADESGDEKTSDSTSAEPVVEKVLIGGTVEGNDDKRYAMIDGQHYVVAVSSKAVAKLDVQPNDLRSRKLADFARLNVDYLRLKRPSDSIVVAKKDMKWRLYEPVAAAADSTAVQDFLRNLSDLEVAEFLDDAKPADYGLDNPAFTVDLWENGVVEKPAEKPEGDQNKKKAETPSAEPPEVQGKPKQIQFGKHEAGRVYAKRGEAGGVVAVDDKILETLEKATLALRDKSIFDFKATEVARLDIVRDGTSYSLENEQKKDNDESKSAGLSDPFLADTGNWRLTKPVEAPANATVARDLASTLRSLRTPRYLAEKPDDLSAYGLADPAIRVTITMKAEGDNQAEQGVLLVGSAVDKSADATEYYAMLPQGDLVFAVEKRLVDLLQSELRDPKIFTFTASDATGLTLAFGDHTWTLKKAKPEGSDTEQWAFEGEAPFELDTKKVDSLLSTLASLKAERFVQYEGGFSGTQGLEPAVLTLTVSLGDKQKTMRVGTAVEQGEGRFAATADLDGAVFVVAADPFGPLADDPTYLQVKSPGGDAATSTPSAAGPADNPPAGSPPAKDESSDKSSSAAPPKQPEPSKAPQPPSTEPKAPSDSSN